MTSGKRESGECRTYANMWKRYKKRVLLAMSSQAFAQLVSVTVYFLGRLTDSYSFRTASMVRLSFGVPILHAD